MSADNGVYILKTSKDHQYRVVHAGAIDNIYYDELNKCDSENMCPLSLLQYFGECKFTYSKDMALRIANGILRGLSVCEYGIQFIESNMSWEYICEDGTLAARKYIKRYGNENEQINTVASGRYLKQR